MVSELEIFGFALGGTTARIDEADGTTLGSIDRALDAVRRHLGMEIAFISEFKGDERVFNHVSTASPDAPIKVGQHLSLDRGYCKKVIDGEIPQLIPDTRALASLSLIPETHSLPIGAHMSVPIIMADGSVYGTFCCLSHHANPTLNDRDLRVLKAVAELVSMQIEASVAEANRKRDILATIRSAISAGEPRIVFQPIFELANGHAVGAEALSRFSQLPYRTPDKWFADAGAVSLRSELEVIAIRHAIAEHEAIWRTLPKRYLAINTSATTLVEHDFLSILGHAPLDRIVIEITEHDAIEDYNLLAKALLPLRSKGIRVAVDDAGSGYASLRHILQLRPDLIKLDISLTKGIDQDPMRRALTAAVVEFSRQIACNILAEGIETQAELSVMSQLGVQFGQGFLLGKPGPSEAILDIAKFAPAP